MIRKPRGMLSLTFSIFVLALLLIVFVGNDLKAAESNPLKTKPRETRVIGHAAYEPSFLTKTGTLDPVVIARNGWKGYLTKMCEPWGLLPGLKPTIRCFFDNRVLPFAELKHHAVDGFDINVRSLGAHAILHEMLGDEKSDDPIEAGMLAYVMSLSDPDGGLPYSPDLMPRQCALGHGETAKTAMMLYEQTGTAWLKDWAAMILKTLRHYAHESHLEGVGPIAEYYQGGNGGQIGFVVGTDPVAERPENVAFDGWQHLYLGWNLWAFAKWNQLTGDTDALNFSLALANRITNSADEYGNDGSYRPDGSFGSTQAVVGSFHGHGHTHPLPGLLLLGGQLIKSERKKDGLRFIEQARRTFEFLYDRSRNPDAGSQTGWVPEFLSVVAGEPWKNHPGDCEGCTMGDVAQTAARLGAASRLDKSLAHMARYYDRAEQIFRGQVVESIFHITPEYRAALERSLKLVVKKAMPDADAATQASEVEKRMKESLATAARMEGRLVGLCGFPDWENNRYWDPDHDLPKLNMMGCCADAAIRAAHAIWTETVTGDTGETRVNLAFNRVSPLVEVVSCLPHRGEVSVLVKDARRILIRIPEWAPKDRTKAYVDKENVPVEWKGAYILFEQVRPGQQLTVTYPLRITEVKEVIKGHEFVEYTEKWRGNTIVDISPPGTWIPMFQRPELESEQVPR